jgi:serine/threonine protein kinase
VKSTYLTNSHPSPDELLRFLSGSLSEAELERVVGHLETCPGCQQILPSLPPSDSLVRALRRPLESEPHAEGSECRQALASAEQGLLARLVPQTPAPEETPRRDAGPSIDELMGSLPREFGRYRLRERLGKGGMGAVYLAEDVLLQRQVALKVARFQGPEGSASAVRFLREARAAAALQHEGICRVLDYGQAEGIHYFTMDYVRGQPLSELVRGGPLEPRQAAEIVRQVAEALEAAHRAELVHRDLKPSNIMLDEDGRPKVIDFGLVRRAQDLTLTNIGDVMGTPRYMSPEQVRGEPTTHATDVFSLGVILYQLLTGRLPFEAPDATSLAHRIANTEPEPPSRHCPGLDRRLEAVCLKALKKPTLLRYATMAAMAADLRQFLSAAEGPTGPYQPRRGVRVLTRRACLIAASLLMPAVVVGGWSALRRRETPREAEPMPAPVLPPLDGWVDIWVWKNCAGKALHLRDDGVRPLEPEDEVAVEAEVTRPAYLYLFWITTVGKVDPLYPWTPGRWNKRPVTEERITRLRRPATEGNFWPLKKGEPGMETLLLLVREEPWPPGVDVRGLLGEFPPQAAQNPAAAVWFENGSVAKERTRQPDYFDERRREDPVLVTQQLLRERLKNQVVYTRAVSFANRNR